MDSIHHVIILGCGRSGTSIFGELFDQLTPFTYHCEPGFHELVRLDYSKQMRSKLQPQALAFRHLRGFHFHYMNCCALFQTPKRFTDRFDIRWIPSAHSELGLNRTGDIIGNRRTSKIGWRDLYWSVVLITGSTLTQSVRRLVSTQ